MDTYGRIYVITNKINGKQYVGQTTLSVAARWRAHPTGDCRALVCAIKKYGVGSFDVRELDTGSNQEELNTKEQHWITMMDTMAPRGYNLREGGSRGKPGADTRRRQSEAHMGKVIPAEVREKMAASQRARRKTEAVAGVKPQFSPEGIQALRDAHTGVRHSEETRQKMRASHRARLGG